MPRLFCFYKKASLTVTSPHQRLLLLCHIFLYFTPEHSKQNMNALVCEDDEIVMKVIQVALDLEGINGTYVKDGRKAMELLQHDSHFDIIITDIHMPYYNGDDILKLVREDQKKNTPIIMISSDSEEEVIALALKLGVDEFISKPADPKKLRKVIRKHITKR